jgi:hypothetical protein
MATVEELRKRKLYFNWFKWLGNRLHKKVRDMARNPIVCIMVEAGFTDGTPPRHVTVVGTAQLVADPNAGDVDKIEGFWHEYQEKYGGTPRLPSGWAGVPKEQEHIYYEVTPIKIYSSDPRKWQAWQAE